MRFFIFCNHGTHVMTPRIIFPTALTQTHNECHSGFIFILPNRLGREQDKVGCNYASVHKRCHCRSCMIRVRKMTEIYYCWMLAEKFWVWWQLIGETRCLFLLVKEWVFTYLQKKREKKNAQLLIPFEILIKRGNTDTVGSLLFGWIPCFFFPLHHMKCYTPLYTRNVWKV